MLLLTFQINNEHYAVRATDVIEILPLTTIRPMPLAPKCIAGVLDYRQKILPVIDLVELTNNRPHNKVLSSRIIIMNYSVNQDNHPIGLIAEKVTDTISIDEKKLSASNITIPNASYLGKMYKDSENFVQIIEVNSILSAEIQNMLFQDSNTLKSLAMN